MMLKQCISLPLVLCTFSQNNRLVDGYLNQLFTFIHLYAKHLSNIPKIYTASPHQVLPACVSIGGGFYSLYTCDCMMTSTQNLFSPLTFTLLIVRMNFASTS